MKATALLRKDHELLRSMLGRVSKFGRANQNGSSIEEIRDEFMMHTRIEDEFLYPELENTSSSQAPAMVNEARARHEQIQKLLDEFAENVSPNTADPTVSTLGEKLEEYFDFEEQLFEEARQYVSEYRMEQLGLEMEERRRFLRLSAA